MCTSANSEDPDVKAHYAAFHQGLHCLLRTNQSSESEKEIQDFLEIITCDPSIYILASLRENLSLEVCEQHRRRPACAPVKSDQRLCYSLFAKYHI